MGRCEAEGRPNVEGQDDEFNNIDPGEPPVLLKAGIYPAQWVKRTIGQTPWGEKLVFHWRVFSSIPFRVSTMKDDSGTPLSGYYNIKRGSGNRFKFGRHHSYRKDWIAANNGRFPIPPSSLPLSVFQDRYLFVQIATVEKDPRGPLHPSNYWSKVQQVIRPVGVDEIVGRLPLQLSEVTWKTP